MERCVRILSVSVLAIIFLIHSSPAGADDTVEPRVVLVSMSRCCQDEAWLEAEKKIRAEFGIMGIEVQTLDGQATDEKGRREELISLAAEHNAVAAIRILRADWKKRAGVDLWIADHLTDKTTYRHIEIDTADPDSSATVTALRVVELLQASLLEIAPRNTEEPKQDIPLPVSELIAEQPASTVNDKFHLFASGSVSWSPGNVGARGGLDIGFNFLPIPSLILGIDATVTFLGADLEGTTDATEDFSSTFNMAAARILVAWNILSDGPVRPSIGALGGMLLFFAKGSGDAEHTGTTEIRAAGYAGLRVHTDFMFNRHLGLYTNITIGSAFPSTSIHIADENIAEFGKVILEGGLGLVWHI